MDTHIFKYVGPVLYFGKVICDRWVGETTAKTEKQARNQLTYQCKKDNNFAPRSMVTLPGQITVIK